MAHRLTEESLHHLVGRGFNGRDRVVSSGWCDLRGR